MSNCKRISKFLHNLSLDFEKMVINKENETISRFNSHVMENDTKNQFSQWYGIFVETLLLRILYEKGYVFSVDSLIKKFLDKTIPTHEIFEEISLCTYCRIFNCREGSMKTLIDKMKLKKGYYPFHLKFVDLPLQMRINVVDAFFDFAKDYFYKDTVYNPNLQYKSIYRTPDFVSKSNIIEIKACNQNIFDFGLYQCMSYYSIIKAYDPEREINKIVILNFKNMTAIVYLIKRFEKDSIDRLIHFLETGEMTFREKIITPIEHLVPVKKKKRGFWTKFKELFLCR